MTPPAPMRLCDQCGQPFRALPGNRKYCGPACMSAAKRKRERAYQRERRRQRAEERKLGVYAFWRARLLEPDPEPASGLRQSIDPTTTQCLRCYRIVPRQPRCLRCGEPLP